MAKQTCESCKAQVGFFQQTKLADDTYLCRNCLKITHPYFAPAKQRSFFMFQEHLKQLENSNLLYEKLFVPRKSTKDKSMKIKKLGGGIEVLKDIGLVAAVAKRGGFLFWGGQYFYMVFRLGDIYQYDYSFELQGGTDGRGKSKRISYISYGFWDTPGCDDFKVQVPSEVIFIDAAKYFDNCFGLTRDYKALVSIWKNKISDIKKAAKGLKASFSGNNDAGGEESAKYLPVAERAARFGDRTDWLAMADAAIKSVLG